MAVMSHNLCYDMPVCVRMEVCKLSLTRKKNKRFFLNVFRLYLLEERMRLALLKESHQSWRKWPQLPVQVKCRISFPRIEKMDRNISKRLCYVKEKNYFLLDIHANPYVTMYLIYINHIEINST